MGLARGRKGKGRQKLLTARDLAPLRAGLLRADMCEGVAPLPRLANRRGGAGSGTAGTSRGGLLALGAGPQHVLVRMGRVSQSNGHGNCKRRYSKGLQHRFLPPWSFAEKSHQTRWPGLQHVCAAVLVGMRQALFKANYGAADFDLNQGRQTRPCYGRGRKRPRAKSPRLRAFDNRPSLPLCVHEPSAATGNKWRCQAFTSAQPARPDVNLSHLSKRAIRPGTHRPHGFCVRPGHHRARSCPQHRRDPRSCRESHS
jgi:hypothetical protein